MAGIQLKTSQPIVPMIYAYTTPEIQRHHGWVKIGYTERVVERRIRQQTHTADVLAVEAWRGNALFDDGSGEAFTDKDFHSYLRKAGIRNEPNTEWFHVSEAKSEAMFDTFRKRRGILPQNGDPQPYTLRQEQQNAVDATKDYFAGHPKGSFLWNAKPRFGKTLAVYDLCQQMALPRVLIVTNRPAIANSWYQDYVQFLGEASGYLFVSHVEALSGKPFVVDEKDYALAISTLPDAKGRIEFVSLQDLKGSRYFGGNFDKLAHLVMNTSNNTTVEWDLLVIDEAHEGVDTDKTDTALEQIQRKYTLHLSGTPFKALANDKFPPDAIYNWTYADEQRAKAQWVEDSGSYNPYEPLPQLNLYTYQISQMIQEQLQHGFDLNGEPVDYAFDLNEFFRVKDGGLRFEHEDSVDRFLDALTTQEKYPFSTEALRAELKHTFWLLSRVESAKLLARKLKQHPVFQAYEIVVAAGDGRIDDMEETKKSYDRVRSAIAQHEKTITLSVGQLTTGVTIPEWTGVMMLSNCSSPALYMQAAFRSQTPWKFREKAQYHRKENAYVFDFDPARTLILFEQFANDLCAEATSTPMTGDQRIENVRTLLNFFPVIGEDEQGKMVRLDAERVLTIPRRLKSMEVVNRGFMCDYLFQNISSIFRAAPEVLDILGAMPAQSRTKERFTITSETADALSLDERGEVSIGEELVIGVAQDLFGSKIYQQPPAAVLDAISHVPSPALEGLKTLEETFRQEVVLPIIHKTSEHYQRDFGKRDQKTLETKTMTTFQQSTKPAYDAFVHQSETIENQRAAALEHATTDTERHQINENFDQQRNDAKSVLNEALTTAIEITTAIGQQQAVIMSETNQKEREKRTKLDEVKNHLRGFSRTIPSFLMAYGNNATTLDTFDEIIPDEVFQEVTGISLDQFRFLRDGGPYTDPSTGLEAHFDGSLFDPVVFNDSIQVFLQKKTELANYFSEDSQGDIFDYIPPQKTNQIFTPKWVVKNMVDLLESENPNCFDNHENTFLDPYMKSGQYIAEIVKRLFRSEGLKVRFPDEKERLKHIFSHQVYGLAPTEIIYRIALNYILGFDVSGDISVHHLRHLDALPLAKDETLSKKLDDLFR